MNLKKIINEAVKVANKSNMFFKLGAVIFDKNYKIIAKGYNKYYFNGNKYSIHAEEDAILKALKKTYLKNLSILVVRVNKHNQLKYSFPCEQCFNLVKHVNIRHVYFSNTKGEIVHIKIY